jgi:protein SCO1/2
MKNSKQKKQRNQAGRALPRLAAVALAMMLGVSLPVAAQVPQILPEAVREVGIDQRLNEPVPLDLAFRDETGKTVQLGDYFGEKPVLLTLVYYECPVLCTMVLNGVVRTLRPLSFSAGEEFELVTVSISPTETPAQAAKKKGLHVSHYDRAGAEDAWHFLTGDETSIRKLTEAVGFRYTYDEETGLYAHASGMILLTPEGKLSRYFYGIEYSARDLRLALIEASENRIGSPVDRVLLYCYQYDPTTGRYGLVIMRVIRVAGLATILLLGGFILLSIRRERRTPGNGSAKLKEA